MRIEFDAKTDVGMIRKENQDSYGILEAKNFYAVCDGMGGGAAGDFASRCAADIMVKAVETLSKTAMNAVLGTLDIDISDDFKRPIAAIRLANRGLHNFTQKYPRLSGMGTTLVAVAFDLPNRFVHVYHVGDSRLYRVREGKIEQLTKDHSKVNELIDQGKMSEAEVKTAEIQSMITRALGTNAKVKIDYRCVELLENDHFVLCSDGLNGELDDRTIRNVIVKNRGNVKAIAAELIERANAAGGRDNTTAVAIRVIETAGIAPAVAIPAGNVFTVGEETAEQLVQEDKELKSIMSKIKVRVPKSAREKVIWNNPFVLAIMLTVIISAVAFLPKRMMRDNPDTKLTDLAGKVAGITLDIRVPVPAQLENFRKAEDNIQRLQMLQDWYRNKDSMTMPLEHATVSVTENGADQYKGMSGATPIEIRMPVGLCSIQVRYRNYQMVNDRMAVMDSMNVVVEKGSQLKPIMIVMMPLR